jgi:hypothetical protein
VTKAGHSAIVSTNGNEDCHVILRGGKAPNYDAAAVEAACAELAKSGLAARVMIDFSHANSSKQFKKQLDVARDVGAQMAAGEDRIFGVMIESHLKEGRQDLKPGKPLDYGVSVTDACIGWEDTLVALESSPKRPGAARGPGRALSTSHDQPPVRRAAGPHAGLPLLAGGGLPHHRRRGLFHLVGLDARLGLLRPSADDRLVAGGALAR